MKKQELTVDVLQRAHDILKENAVATDGNGNMYWMVDEQRWATREEIDNPDFDFGAIE